jgi:hypothetical protein
MLGIAQETIFTVIAAEDNWLNPLKERTVYSTNHAVVYGIVIVEDVTVDVVVQ